MLATWLTPDDESGRIVENVSHHTPCSARPDEVEPTDDSGASFKNLD